MYVFIEFDAFGDVLKPTVGGQMQQQQANNFMKPLNSSNIINSGNNNNGAEAGDKRILSTDLESSLASLADNLDINRKNNNFQ